MTAIGAKNSCRRDTDQAPRSAFTLLEVILAVTLGLGLVGSVMVFYDHAANVRKAVLSDAEMVAAERIIMDRITDELRGATVYPFLDMGVEGRPGEIHFITTALPGPRAWAVRKATEDPIPPACDLRIVGYRLGTSEDENGRMQINGLERTDQRILTARTAQEGREIIASLLTPHVRFIRFRYRAAGGWTESWTRRDLPGAVEITLGFKPLPEDTDPQDYPYQTFRRVVFVPGSSMPTSGAIVRGLHGSTGR